MIKNEDETYTLTEKEVRSFIDSVATELAYEVGGVDNWSGADYAEERKPEILADLLVQYGVEDAE